MHGDQEILVKPIPSFILRPRPSYDTSPDPCVLLGGKPQLPANLDWPSELSFYAQINLAKVPKSFTFEDTEWHLSLPTSGTLFVFLPLADPYDVDGQVLYSDKDVSHLPEREPPHDIPNLRAWEKEYADYWIDTVGLSDCGRLLYRQRADLLPFLSAFSVNGLWANMEDAEGNPNYVQQNKAAQALEKATKTAAFKTSPMPPPPDKRKVCSSMDTHRSSLSKRTFAQMRLATMSWEFIFDYSREVLSQSLSLGSSYVDSLFRDEEFKKDHAILKRMKDTFLKRKNEVLNEKYQPTPQVGLRHKLSMALAQRRALKKRRFDDRAKAWMDVARHSSNPVPAKLASHFWNFVEEIHQFEAPERSKLNLSAIDSWIRETRLGAYDVYSIGRDAMKVARHHLVINELPEEEMKGALPHVILKMTRDTALADRYWDEKIREELQISDSSGPHNFTIGPQKTQMLGAPFAVQPEVDELAKSKVMLLQIAGECGMQVNPSGGNFQFWIRPGHLENRAFDKVSFTYFFT